jgi:hypothetical protein
MKYIRSITNITIYRILSVIVHAVCFILLMNIVIIILVISSILMNMLNISNIIFQITIYATVTLAFSVFYDKLNIKFKFIVIFISLLLTLSFLISLTVLN